MIDSQPPSPFKSWEECRQFYCLEGLMRLGIYDDAPSKRNKKRVDAAMRKANAANAFCEEPLPSD